MCRTECPMSSFPVKFSYPPIPSFCFPSTQYNVTVVGVDKSGRITKGGNMLQFKTPKTDALRAPPPRRSPKPPPPKRPPPPPSPTIKLIFANATNSRRGRAIAEPSRAGIFVKVCPCRLFAMVFGRPFSPARPSVSSRELLRDVLCCVWPHNPLNSASSSLPPLCSTSSL